MYCDFPGAAANVSDPVGGRGYGRRGCEAAIDRTEIFSQDLGATSIPENRLRILSG